MEGIPWIKLPWFYVCFATHAVQGISSTLFHYFFARVYILQFEQPSVIRPPTGLDLNMVWIIKSAQDHEHSLIDLCLKIFKPFEKPKDYFISRRWDLWAFAHLAFLEGVKISWNQPKMASFSPGNHLTEQSKRSAKGVHIDPHDSLNTPLKHYFFGMRHANLVVKRVHIFFRKSKDHFLAIRKICLHCVQQNQCVYTCEVCLRWMICFCFIYLVRMTTTKRAAYSLESVNIIPDSTRPDTNRPGCKNILLPRFFVNGRGSKIRLSVCVCL